MVSKDNFEQLSFNVTINTIHSANYPKKFPTHWHKHVEMIAVLEDADSKDGGIIKINQEQYHLYPGDILFIWPGELHEVQEDRGESLVALQFPITILTEIRDFAVYMNLFRNGRYLSRREHEQVTKEMFVPMMKIFEISENWSNKFRNVQMLIQMYEMFMVYGEYIQNNQLKFDVIENESGKIEDKVQLACNYIQQNCELDLTLDSVAEKVGFSSYYFSRCFKKITGYNFIEYLMLQRVKRLQFLLTDSEKTITDAAYQAGFKSISTLNRVFKQYSGCSPSEYRKYYIV